jgi:hypothetical protein
MNISGNQAVRWPSPKLGHFLWQVADDSSVGTWINTSREDINMKMWNKLLAVLDQVYGFPNMASSTLKKLEQGYDNETEEHVIRLEYRIKIGDALPPKQVSRTIEQKQVQRIKHLNELAARISTTYHNCERYLCSMSHGSSCNSIGISAIPVRLLQ